MKFTKLQKILIPIFVVLLAIVLGFDTAILRAFKINPYQIDVSYQKLSSKKIPKSMDQMSIVYITDLEAGQFSTPEELDRLFEKIRELDPDIFLFGGDLFWSDAQISEETRRQMVDQLSSIKAPLGKFAVYGEQDLVSEERRRLVDSIYEESQVEVLVNSSVTIANQDRSPIRLA